MSLAICCITIHVSFFFTVTRIYILSSDIATADLGLLKMIAHPLSVTLSKLIRACDYAMSLFLASLLFSVSCV